MPKHRDRALALKVINALDIDELLKTSEGINTYDRLLKMRSNENANMWRQATKLRLRNQSRLRSEKAARRVDDAPVGLRPWEFDG